jgi:transcriptional regulator with XRE-family HTH domain
MARTRIKMLRRVNNISQEELAKAIGLSNVSISDYEHGKSDPNIKTLKKLSKYFGVSIDYLIMNITYRY